MTNVQSEYKHAVSEMKAEILAFEKDAISQLKKALKHSPLTGGQKITKITKECKKLHIPTERIIDHWK